MTMLARNLTAFLMLAALVAATAVPLLPSAVAGPREAAALAFQDGRIAFSRFVDPPGPTPGDFEIFTMDADGSDLKQLTENTIHDSMPDWSPDGTKIAFSQGQGTIGTISVMDSNGANLTPITQGHNDSHPDWSPDGASIAFIRQEVFGNPNQLYVMAANGANQRNLNIQGGAIFEPKWSPDGQRIAFFRTLPEDTILTVRPDGSDLKEIGPGIHPSWSPDGSQFAFVKRSGGQSDIFVMNADGTGATNRTNSSAREDEPEWSPGGVSIVYTTVSSGGGEIFTMNISGSQQINRTNTPAIPESAPSWQPIPIPPPPPAKIPILDRPKFKRGDVIVFSSNQGTPFVNLFKLELRPLGGNVLTQLTFDTIRENIEPEWSHDGSKIAFARRENGRVNIYTMNANGTNVAQVTNAPGTKEDHNPAWSPDGTKIVFSSNRDGPSDAPSQIFVIGADGSNLTKLTNSLEPNFDPDWSPDGTRIAFSRQIEIGGGFTRGCIFTMNPDGSGETQLTFPEEGYGSFPAWSPDGSKIAFTVVTAVGEHFIYFMDADGSNLRKIPRIIGTVGSGSHMSWSPDGRQFVFEHIEPGTTSPEIFTMKANGTSFANRTNAADGTFHLHPDWSPNPAQSASAAAAVTNSGESVKDKQPSSEKDDKNKDKKKKKKQDKGKKEKKKQGKQGNKDKKAKHRNHDKRRAGGRDRDRDRDRDRKRDERKDERANVSEPRNARDQRGDRKKRH